MGDDLTIDERLRALGVRDDDLVEKFVRGTGAGGQKMNKTSLCVHLRHIPTGIEARVQQSRSREANRIRAREILCDKLEQRELLERQKIDQAREKKRRQKRQPSKAAKKRNVERKRKRGAVKRTRGRLSRTNDED